MQVHDYPLKARHDDLPRAAPSRPAAPPGRLSSRRLNSWPRNRWFSLPALVLVPSLAISAAIVVTAPGSSALHVAPAWAWLLTGAQIAGMWLVGNSKPHGWLVGAAAQPAWITYAILSGQYGFIPGCAVSLVVQIWNFSRQTGSRPETASSRHLAHNLRSVTERTLRRPRHHGLWRQRSCIGARCLTGCKFPPNPVTGRRRRSSPDIRPALGQAELVRPTLLIGLRMEQRGPQPPDHLIAASRYRC